MDTADGEKRRVGELEDMLKQRDRTILELRQEAEKAQALIAEMREHVQDADDVVEGWCEAFGLEMGDDERWHWRAWVATVDALHEDYVSLVRRWNALVPKYNAAIAPRTVGRPLAASDAQQRQVLALRKAGKSLRAIVNTTGLSLRTVRTIVGKADGTDRVSRRMNELRRLELNRAAMASYRAKKRVRDALPKRINALLERGPELLKRAR
jgi:DNA-binding CsgD family transcriptional regulator